ncbi:hypothetical protein [Sulfuriflexus mobilis]|uniref:hypothetical protein n=1 Tax=Sulfuriflexus mobilis TaxID=1811807 RepID=UPI000F82D3A6|nr:hypothetical protein [Sulfuriflexus mobilis]
MPVIIDCPGQHTFTSSKTRTSWGVSTSSNRRTAIARAQAAVLNDLTNQINAAQCAPGCLKVPGGTNAPVPTATCERKWWALWIVVRCASTATASATVQCTVQG